MIEAVDTYYLYVKQQMKLVDPTQKFGPIIASRDWPQTPPIDSTLYLIYLASLPAFPGTATITLFIHTLQWIWLIMGDDIGPMERKQNRGDRYRALFTIQKKLRDANYPGFCPKTFIAADGNGNLTSTSITSPQVGGAETIFWTTPRFMPKFDSERSGLAYGNGAVSLYGYDDISQNIQAPYPQPFIDSEIVRRLAVERGS